MIRDIAHIIHPDIAGRRYIMVLAFKFDESHKNSRSFVVAGWMGEERHWKRVEKRWQKAIAFENKTLPGERKISRYHASHMNANDCEFKGWENESYRKLRFTKKLLKIVGVSQLSAVAIGLDLDAFLKIFPDRDPPDFGIPYVICIRQLMYEIAFAMQEWPEDCRVALVHDHGDWDKLALEGYNQLVDDPEWEHRHRFVSITPLTWKDDVGLQAADLIAYELMRRLDDTLWTGRDIRIPLKAILEMNNHVSGKYLDHGELKSLKQRIFTPSGERDK